MCWCWLKPAVSTPESSALRAWWVPNTRPLAAVSTSSDLLRAVLSADQEADKNAALFQLWCMRGEAGPPLHLDQRLHRCEQLWIVHPSDTWLLTSSMMWQVCCLPGARNHHYYVLFLLSLTLMGSWMFYCCLMCEWPGALDDDGNQFWLEGASGVCLLFQTGPLTACCIMPTRACGPPSPPWWTARRGCSASSSWPSITPAGLPPSCWCSCTRWHLRLIWCSGCFGFQLFLSQLKCNRKPDKVGKISFICVSSPSVVLLMAVAPLCWSRSPSWDWRQPSGPPWRSSRGNSNSPSPSDRIRTSEFPLDFIQHF